MLGSEFSAPKMIAFYFARHDVLDAPTTTTTTGFTRHYVFSSSTRSVPVANTDAGHPPSSEGFSEPLPLAALGAAGAVDGETCVPICDRSPCAEPEIKYNGISFCSYGRRQSQFLTDHNGVTLKGGIPVEAVRSRSERVCKTGGDIKIEGLDVGASR